VNKQLLGLHGFWKTKIYENVDAYLRQGSPIWTYDGPNGITDPGIHYLLEVGFRGDDMAPVSQIAPWYAGLIDAAGFGGVAAGDTLASNSWDEFIDYDESTRIQFVFPAAATRAITDSVAFTISDTGSVQGIIVTEDDTIGGTTGLLWSTALFGSPASVVNGNVLTANYVLTD
jgi:hypothetical protein